VSELKCSKCLGPDWFYCDVRFASFDPVLCYDCNDSIKGAQMKSSLESSQECPLRRLVVSDGARFEFGVDSTDLENLKVGGNTDDAIALRELSLKFNKLIDLLIQYRDDDLQRSRRR